MRNLNLLNLKRRISKTYEEKLEDLMSLCDSEIEKLMLMNLLNYLDSFRIHEGFIKNYSDVSLITEVTDPPFESSPEEFNVWKRKVENYKYKARGGQFEKTIGFKAKSQLFKFDPDSKTLPEFRIFEIYPQYDVLIGRQHYKIDIAIIMHRLSGDEVVETRRIGIECDGYEYHHTREQITNDERRKRQLKRAGWRDVLRYSGSEIFNIQDSAAFDRLFTEIIDILYL